MCDCELSRKLVELGAYRLGPMLSELKAKNYEAAHYFKGGSQALTEAAFSLSGIDSDGFRSRCLDVTTGHRLDG